MTRPQPSAARGERLCAYLQRKLREASHTVEEEQRGGDAQEEGSACANRKGDMQDKADSVWMLPRVA